MLIKRSASVAVLRIAYQFPIYVNKITLNIKLLVTKMRYESNPSSAFFIIATIQAKTKSGWSLTIGLLLAD